MPRTAISAGVEQVVLERGSLRIELELRPFAFTIRHAGRRVIRAGGVWVADGTSQDHFVQMTEGVIPNEQLGPHERAQRAVLASRSEDGVVLVLKLEGGRTARLSMTVSVQNHVSLTLAAEGDPVRLAV